MIIVIINVNIIYATVISSIVMFLWVIVRFSVIIQPCAYFCIMRNCKFNFIMIVNRLLATLVMILIWIITVSVPLCE